MCIYIHIYIYCGWQNAEPALVAPTSSSQSSSAAPFWQRRQANHRCPKCGKDWQKAWRPPAKWAPGSATRQPRLPMATSDINPQPTRIPKGSLSQIASVVLPHGLGTLWAREKAGWSVTCQPGVQWCGFTLPKIQCLENIHHCTVETRLSSTNVNDSWRMLDSWESPTHHWACSDLVSMFPSKRTSPWPLSNNRPIELHYEPI